MKLVFTKSLALSGLVLLAVSCGKPKVVTPESTKLNLPEFNNGTNFRLADNAEEQEFNGALVLWDKNLDSNKLVPLLKATRVYNEAYTDYAKTLTDVIDNQLASAKNLMTEKKVVFEKLNAEDSKLQLESSLAKSALWFENTIKAKTEQFPQIDIAKANAVFARYCDAKVIEFASSKSLARETYSRRPTPAALCENYYTGKLFDVNTPECAPAEQGQTKNYLACFWNEGVLKSSYALGDKRLMTDDQVLAIRALANSDIFKKSLETPIDNENVECKYFEIRREPVAPVALVKMTRALQKITLNFNIGSRTGTGFLKQTKMRCGDLEASFTLLPTTFAPLYAKAPSEVITGVENNFNTTTDDFRFISKVAADGSAQNAELIEFAGQVHARVAGLNQLNQNCTYPMEKGSDKLVSEASSVNELRFNGPLRSQAILCPDADKATLPNVFGAVNAELEAAKVEFKNAADASEAARAMLCAAPKDSCDASRMSEFEFQNCNIKEATAYKAKYVSEPGVTSAVSKLKLVTKPMGGVGVFLKLVLSETEFGYACLDSLASGLSIDCPDSVVIPQGSKLMMASYNPSNSKLSISLALNDLDLLLKSKDDRFPSGNVVDLSPENAAEILGKTLKIELYPNSFDGFVPYLSGKALILDGDKEIYQGAASYLINEKKFDDKKNQACK